MSGQYALESSYLGDKLLAGCCWPEADGRVSWQFELGRQRGWIMELTGECFCGAIKYKIDGALTDPLSCHCSRCRKAFSSQSSNYARVNSADFLWLAGEEKLTSYVGKHGFGLLFCSTCGSTLCGTIDKSVHGVSLGCLNEEPELDQIHHIFVDSKASWEVLPSGVKTFAEGRQEIDRR